MTLLYQAAKPTVQLQSRSVLLRRFYTAKLLRGSAGSMSDVVASDCGRQHIIIVPGLRIWQNGLTECSCTCSSDVAGLAVDEYASPRRTPPPP